MPAYRFRYTYRVTGETVLEFEDDEQAKAYGWYGDDLTAHDSDIHDWDLDADDVDIARLDDNGEFEEEIWDN